MGAKRSILTLLAAVLASPTFAADLKPPFAITSFESLQSTQTLRTENLGTPCFAVQFRMKDPFVPELERAAIYLFDDQNKLIHTLTETAPRVFLSRTEKKQKSLSIDYPNIITVPEDLKYDQVYTLIFRHMLPTVQGREVYARKTEFKWKYALAVLGAEDQYVFKVLPRTKKVEELEFPEKKSGIEN